MKTREEVAKLATAVANVPVNPGALTFFLYTNCKCAIVSPGGEYYTLVLSVYSKVVHESYCH